MTLVIGYINTNFAMMAADRRTTIGTKLKDDDRTKIINWENKILIGFTGIAELGSERIYTMEWLANVLAKHNKFDSDLITKELIPILQKTNVNKQLRRLAFMVSGYDNDDKIFYCLISNMHDNEGNLLSIARDDFWVSLLTPKVRSTIHVIGQNIPVAAGHQLLDRLKKTHNNILPSEKTVSNILAGAIEASAGVYVSKTCLIATVRKGKTRGGFTVVTPNSKPGQKVDIASPYFVVGGTIMTMPSQQLPLARARK